MADLYLVRSKTVDPKATSVRAAVSAVQWKYLLSCVHLEELWALSEHARLSLVDLISNSTEEHQWSEDQVLEGALRFESFLFQARAFLDVYMRLICIALDAPTPAKMSRSKFEKALAQVPDGAITAANRCLEFFGSDVFADGQWGQVIVSLRDKIAHSDRLRASRHGSEVVVGVRLDWPTVRGLTLERLAQEFNNGTFELLRTTTPIIFDLAWQSGPDDPQAWSAG